VALRHLDLNSLEPSGPLCVAEIREEPNAVGFDEECGARALEAAGQIDDVRRRRDEQRLLEELAEAIYPRARNSSASL
jgi:hypothetical protein